MFSVNRIQAMAWRMAIMLIALSAAGMARADWQAVDDPNIVVEQGNTLFDRATRTYYSDLSVHNQSASALPGELRAVVESANKTAENPDGTTDGGEPYYLLLSGENAQLEAGQRLEERLGFTGGRGRLDYSVRLEHNPPMGIQPSFAAPVTDPEAFFTNTPTQVRVLAQILPDPDLDTASVELYRVDDNLNPVGPALCQLQDNGNLGNGDDINGDSVYSCFVDFNEASPVTIQLAARALLAGAPISSAAALVHAVNQLTQEQAQIVVDSQAQAQQFWEDMLAQFGDTLQARQETVALILNLPGVADAGVSSDDVTIWIQYESGLLGGLMLNPEGTRGAPPRDSQAMVIPEDQVRDPVSFSAGPAPAGVPLFSLAAVEDTPIENTRVLVWDAYNFQFAPFDEGPGLQMLYQNANCPLFDVTYLKDQAATVNSVKNFTQYGTVIMVTHGAVDGSNQVVFLTTEQASVINMLLHPIDLVLNRISVMGDVFAIRPSFIAALGGGFENSVVYNGSCQSSANNTMANAFIGKGAKTYYGFTRVVNSNFAQSVATQLFTAMVNNLDNTGDSFTPVMPKVDPTAPNATFTQTGDTMLAYTGNLVNGGFEEGDLTGWTRAGDGRVIASLGAFTPTAGSFMGIVSTGLGFTTDSGSIEQNFCLPQNATNLKFKWNYNSEEFIEWCGAQHPFDDPFQVVLETEGGNHTLVNETVDSLCANVVPTALAFDQSGPGCSPDPDTGLGTGLPDCTVWSNLWVAEDIDISAIAAANQSKGVTLRFRSFDAGDSIFDTAVLIDEVEVVQP